MHGRRVQAWQEGGHAWQGGMHSRGVCMARGMYSRGHVWQGGMHLPPPTQILRNTVNERAVRILLECILV